MTSVSGSSVAHAGHGKGVESSTMDTSEWTWVPGSIVRVTSGGRWDVMTENGLRQGLSLDRIRAVEPTEAVMRVVVSGIQHRHWKY